MKEVEIKIKNAKFIFLSDTPEKLEALSEKIVKKVEALSKDKNFDNKILLMAMLLMQEELEALQESMNTMQKNQDGFEGELKASLADTINKVAIYIENLALQVEEV